MTSNGNRGDIILAVEGLDARYGQIQALRGISFEVAVGEVVVMLGANGAGKTTTLRAVCNMPIVHSSGSVKLNDHEIHKKDTADIVHMGVAHIPQGRGTFPELSVLDNLEVGGYVRKDDLKSDKEKYFEMFPRLAERRDQLAGSLSGGEQQMLAVARALKSRPKLLLLDEPSLGLAPLIIEDLFRRFAELNRVEGTTMLIVEQNANLALNIATYGYVLEAGEVVLAGPADQLKNDPSIQAAYLGA